MRLLGLVACLAAGLAAGCFGGDDGGIDQSAATGSVAGSETSADTTVVTRGTTTTVPPAAEEPDWPTEPAGEFILRVNRQLVEGDAEQAWKTLHPWHRVVAPKGRFVECYDRALDDVPEDLVSLERSDAKQVEVEILGRNRTVPAQEVVVRYELPLGLEGERQTFHAVVVGGEWRWLLPERYYRAFQRGGCPTL